MTYQELLDAAREAWLQGQDAPTRALFAMRPRPDETASDFEARQAAAAQAIPKLDGPIAVFQWEPLVVEALRTQAGITSLPTKGGAIPVPHVFLKEDGTVDLDQAEQTLANFHAAFSPNPDFTPADVPFKTPFYVVAAPPPQPKSGVGSLWEPLDNDATPEGGTWGNEFGRWVKVRLFGQAGATGQGVAFWKRVK